MLISETQAAAGLVPGAIGRFERPQRPHRSTDRTGQPASLETLKALGAAFEIDFSDLKELDMNSTSSQSPSNQNVSNDEALALRHVRKLKAFYFTLMLYGTVIGFLAIVNLVTYRHYLWFFWPALGWGFGMLVYGLSVFDRIPFLNGEWERRQVEKQLGRKL